MDESGQLKRALFDAYAGAISGAVSTMVTSPLDVIKMRFLVQLVPPASMRWLCLPREVYCQSKYTGMLQAMKDIFRKEGLPGFWRGSVPALLMAMPYTALQFTVLHKLKPLAELASGSSKSEDHINISPYLSYVSGAFAGCAATVGSYPFYLLRTLLAFQGEPKVYPNMRSAFVDILNTRGIRGLYTGLTPALVEIVPYAGLQFGTYDTLKRWTMAWNRFRNPHVDDALSSFQLFLCGLGAGTCAKAVCRPLDVVKSRFQIQGLGMGRETDPSYRAYSNMHHALRRILRPGGFFGLYKGIIPSIVKAAPAGAVTLVAYEFTSEWLESQLI